MPFADNPFSQFSPAGKQWEIDNKTAKPAPPVLTDTQLYDLVVSANPQHIAGPSNPANPVNPNSPLYVRWLASPANPSHPNHKAFLAANPTKKDK